MKAAIFFLLFVTFMALTCEAELSQPVYRYATSKPKTTPDPYPEVSSEKCDRIKNNFCGTLPSNKGPQPVHPGGK